MVVHGTRCTFGYREDGLGRLRGADLPSACSPPATFPPYGISEIILRMGSWGYVSAGNVQGATVERQGTGVPGCVRVDPFGGWKFTLRRGAKR